MAKKDTLSRLRGALARRRGITENRMFGGTCFYVNGNMIGGVTGKGELTMRVGPQGWERALQEPHARPMDFTGRPLRGYVYVDPPGYRSDKQLRTWVERVLKFGRSLPPK